MIRCVRCYSPDTRPGVVFGSDGVCQACKRYEDRRNIDWGERQRKFEKLCDYHRFLGGVYDCIVPVSGGKDSHYQVATLRAYNMNPLLVSVTDDFRHTDAGVHNARNIGDEFGCDTVTLRINSQLNRAAMRYGFEHFGSTNWAVDRAIYTWPLRVAAEKGIPLVVYGENVPWEYGGVSDVETHTAIDQLKNDVVKGEGMNIREMVDERLWNAMTLPKNFERKVEPVYLSYYFPWNDLHNLEVATRHGFRRLTEWKRQGYIDDYAQIDSVGYLYNYYLKYLKYGIGRVTDIGSRLVRYGKMELRYLISLVGEKDHLLDVRIVEDFARVAGYSVDECNKISQRWHGGWCERR